MTQDQLDVDSGPRATVPWWRAAGIEFRLLARVERAFLLGGAGLVMAGVIWASVKARTDMHFEAPGDYGGAFMATMLFALLWSGEVWRDAPADARDWFWAQPIDQGAHELARLLAGIGWVAIAAVFLILAQVLMMVASGFPLGLSRQSSVMWLAFLTGPLTLFLLGSIPGLRSAHPLRWTVGVAIGLSMVPEMLGRNAHLLRNLRNLLFDTLLDPFNHARRYQVGWSAPQAFPWLLSATIALLVAVVAVGLAARVRRPS